MPRWVQDAYQEYAKRLPKELTPSLKEIAIAQGAKNKEKEGEAILAAKHKNHKLVMLDVNGKPWSTEQFSQQLANWQMEGQGLSFVIGGPDGLSQSCLSQADAKWSLSNLILPHPLVRVVFIEQLYRAWTILQGHPYHK